MCKSGKIAYTTAASAMKVSRESGKRFMRYRTANRPYRCQHCSAWHLTSHPLMAEQNKKANQQRRTRIGGDE